MIATGAAQHEAWASRVLPPVEQLATDLWSIPIPIPDNPLRYTLVYAFGSDSGVTLIDAGWGDDRAWQCLSDGLAALGASAAAVTGVLVTHQHFDHHGLARWVRETSGAWIAMHSADRDIIARPDFRHRELTKDLEARWFAWLGAPGEEIAELQVRDRLDRDAAFVIPDRLVDDRQEVVVSGRTLQAVHTPGHTPGHLAFFDHRTRLMFSGDTLLPRISPNVSATPYHGVDGDALGDFLESLDRIGDLDPGEVLPAHEWRFVGVRARVGQLRAHHERRLAELLDLIRANPGSVPWDLAGQVTWSRPWDQYSGFMRISAVGETMAHLVHLRRRGLVSATAGSVPRYFPTDRADSWSRHRPGEAH